MQVSDCFFQITDLNLRYQQRDILRKIEFSLKAGRISCLLGPSGCGKSTLLRSIAGLEQPDRGQIVLEGTVLTSQSKQVPIQKRQIGMVFQDMALFPHLSVAQNVSFGLPSSSDSRQRVNQLLELVGLADLAQRYPYELSGGQQQRIALIRALAPKPKLLLMDEPFSGLDATLKEELIPQIRQVLLEEHISAIIVTHDQMEAFALADDISVMNQGCIEQSDLAYEIYHQPRTRFVADFIGQGYFIPAQPLNAHQINTELGILNLPEPLAQTYTGPIELLLRPDDILHDDDSNYQGVIVQKQFRGTFFQYQVQLSNGRKLWCIASSHHNHAFGQPIGIRLDLDHFVLFEGVERCRVESRSEPS